MFNLGKYFNGNTINGRANVAKATYASFALLYIYHRFRKRAQKKEDINLESSHDGNAHGHHNHHNENGGHPEAESKCKCKCADEHGEANNEHNGNGDQKGNNRHNDHGEHNGHNGHGSNNGNGGNGGHNGHGSHNTSNNYNGRGMHNAHGGHRHPFDTIYTGDNTIVTVSPPDRPSIQNERSSKPVEIQVQDQKLMPLVPPDAIAQPKKDEIKTPDEKPKKKTFLELWKKVF